MIIFHGLGAARTGTASGSPTPTSFAPSAPAAPLFARYLGPATAPPSAPLFSRYRAPAVPPPSSKGGSGTTPPADPVPPTLVQIATAPAPAQTEADKRAQAAVDAAASAGGSVPFPPTPLVAVEDPAAPPLVVEDTQPGAGVKVTVTATEPVAPPKSKWKLWAGIGAGAAALVGGAVLLSKADGAGLMGLGRARRRRR